jgi:hypothetical protein
MLNSAASKKRKKKQKKLQQRLEKAAKEASRGLEDDSDEESEDEDDEAGEINLNDRGFDEKDLGFTAEDLDACMRVVRSLGGRIADFKSHPFRELRGALHPLIEEQMKNYDVKASSGNKRRKKEAPEEQQLPSLKELDKQWRNKTALRSKRLAALEELNAATGAITGPDNKPLLLTHKGEIDEVSFVVQAIYVQLPCGYSLLFFTNILRAAARGHTFLVRVENVMEPGVHI